MRQTTPDLTGQRFGRLTVISSLPKVRANTSFRWQVLCDCGVTKGVDHRPLVKGYTVSCGCWRVEHMAQVARTHGRKDSPEYNCWSALLRRCYCASDHKYPDYGGRGIVVCDAWRNSFEMFFRDMGPRPGPTMSIDRIDNNGPYSPENCRWATRKEQSCNRRGVVLLEYNGISDSVNGWSGRVNLPTRLIRRRLDDGMSVQDTLTKPLSRKRPCPKKEQP